MNKEREKAILEIAFKEKSVTVSKLAKRLYASEPSIRRDLASLSRQKLLRRVHGGAVLDENGISEIKVPFLVRELEKSDEKLLIARKAADLVTDNSVIFLDASTSCYNMIPFLSEKSGILVITNGIKALTRLGEYNIKCIGTGGDVVNSCLAFVGDSARNAVERYNADFCFFSSRGLSEKGEITDISEAESCVRRAMLSRSKQAYMLCTSDKLGKLFYCKLCNESELSGVIKA